ncbi:MAG: twin-arginine translocase TatA/TatE family subunit [Gemmataceae bacterium]
MTSLLGNILGGVGFMEMAIILFVGVLIFGRKLPDVGRSLGKGIVEFKKGLRGLEDEVDTSVQRADAPPPALEAPRPPQRVATSAPKFEENAVNQPPKFN